MKKIAIIGAGYSGLACAKKLLEKEYTVTIFEKQDEIGGMAICIIRNGYIIDKHYRHIFQSDTYMINLLNEMGLNEDLQWLNTRMAYYSSEGLYEFGTPLSLLRYKPLNFIQKIKFGLSIINLKFIKNYKDIEKYSVKEWLVKRYGESIYNKVWEPLMNGKFQNEKEKVSMAWLWGKINLRSTNGTMKGEKLGYLMGSWKKLNDRLYSYLIENKCIIKLQEKVEKVYKSENKYIIETDKNKYEEFDEVVSTLPYNTMEKIFNDILDNNEIEKIKQMKYMSAKTLLINSKKSISPYYWINVGDNSIPFVGIIEHTNMVHKTNYNSENIIYISNYLDKNDEKYKMSAKELLELYLPYLKKINSKIDLNDIISAETFEEEYAQPVIKTNYSKDKLNNRLSSGVYIANMAQIYPEDRGMNYAIKLGYNIAELIN